MNTSEMPAIKYIAEIPNAIEITLIGRANLEFWSNTLRPYGLFPHAIEGQAEIAIGATEIIFNGMKSNELTIGIAVSEQESGATHDGQFLIHAYNSSRLFAFIERTFFQTPYYHANLFVQVQQPVTVRMGNAEAPIFSSKLGDQAVPEREEDQMWVGKIYLPEKDSSKVGKYFIARLGGFTQIYPFVHSRDSLIISPHRQERVFRSLLDSRFEATHEIVREVAHHSRTATFRRA